MPPPKQSATLLRIRELSAGRVGNARIYTGASCGMPTSSAFSREPNAVVARPRGVLWVRGGRGGAAQQGLTTETYCCGFITTMRTLKLHLQTALQFVAKLKRQMPSRRPDRSCGSWVCTLKRTCVLPFAAPEPGVPCCLRAEIRDMKVRTKNGVEAMAPLAARRFRTLFCSALSLAPYGRAP